MLHEKEYSFQSKILYSSRWYRSKLKVLILGKYSHADGDERMLRAVKSADQQHLHFFDCCRLNRIYSVWTDIQWRLRGENFRLMISQPSLALLEQIQQSLMSHRPPAN
tara:strand:- start:236 stop:559 length:324 start_codon:yes stop_codon:yes gene_type:complete